MEKLIELLNEYERYLALGGIADRREFDGNLHYYSEYNDEYVFDHIHQRIISKKFGFIKWLVENDKIDTDAYKTVYSGDLDKRKTLTMSSGGDEFYQVTEHGVYESLLMLLSISDTPIEDLISYLK